MQAIVTTSRAISQDKFHEREIKRKYGQHVRQVDNISNKKSHPILQHLKQTEAMAKTLYKSKSSAKKFQTNQTNAEIKRQNRILLEKVWKISSQIKCEPTKQQVQMQHISGSNWYYKKRQAEAIKQENKRIASNIINTKIDTRDYKKKIQNQIKEYLGLRDQIRKFKLEDSQKKDKKDRKRINSERGLVTLKLNDNESSENIENDKKPIQTSANKMNKTLNARNSEKSLHPKKILTVKSKKDEKILQGFSKQEQKKQEHKQTQK